ncbi:MAG: hypothetical protein MJE12_04485 [Alphaproteobacteria bacterium]|nr:hypothetical protein [Alphaproteobacteria bacterium]
MEDRTMASSSAKIRPKPCRRLLILTAAVPALLLLGGCHYHGAHGGYGGYGGYGAHRGYGAYGGHGYYVKKKRAFHGHYKGYGYGKGYGYPAYYKYHRGRKHRRYDDD